MCQGCGTENPPDAIFCEQCGKQLVPPGTAPAPTPVALAQRGYLTLPDGSQIEITLSQRGIGRVDLARFLTQSDDLNQISRAHATVWSESTPDGQAKFFVEDGVTNVQNKASLNGTALVRSGNREEIKEKGRHELQNGDEIDIAEVIKLKFTIQ
jgi:pSer/pThr/pTyr-binding forkhead associated (FHA) protein